MLNIITAWIARPVAPTAVHRGSQSNAKAHLSSNKYWKDPGVRTFRFPQGLKGGTVAVQCHILATGL